MKSTQKSMARGWSVLLLATCLFLSACASTTQTVVPKPVVATAPSFDGSHADSGLIASVDGQFLISEFARTKFNALAERYGKATDFLKPVSPDDGVKPASAELVQKYQRGQLYLMTPESMSNFARMSRWQREGKASPK